DWSQIKELKKRVNFPIVGNGDVQTIDDVYRMKEQTGCDLVMSGRGLAARPWMLWQLAEDQALEMPDELRHREAPRSSVEEGAEYGRALQKLIQFSGEAFSEDLALRKLRFYIRTTSVWLLFGHTLVSISTKAKNLTELQSMSLDFFKQPQEMTGWTELRQ
ncbi:MAG: tRNA-dihydrouridine synthase, partial [Bdellovibrionales bacterium]